MNVHMQLIERESAATIAESDVPLESLPQSFARMATTLQVGAAQYQVVQAEPATREAIAQSGTVRLTVRKVDAAEPKKLFKCATVEDITAPAGPVSAAAKGDPIFIAEDEYRQVEYVHSSLMSEIDLEIAEIE